MDKQSTLAFILIGLILVVWLYFNSPTPPPQTQSKPDTTQVKSDSIVKPPVEEKKIVEEVSPEESTPFGESNKPEKIITIETDLAKVELTSKGAKIRRYFLKKYKTWYHNEVEDTNFYNQYVQLVNTNRNGGDFSILFVTKEGKLVNTSSLDFTTSADNYYYRISGKDSIKFSYAFSAGENKSIVKDFVFYGDNYASKVEVELNNMQDIISSYRYDVVWADGLNFVEKNSVDEATNSNASVYAGDEQTIIDAPIGEKVTKDINGKIDWVAVRNKYFAMIISPDKPSDEGGAYFEGTHVKKQNLDEREYYSASLKVQFKGESKQRDAFTLYLGPIDYDILKSYDRNFQTVFDFGSFFGLKFIIRPLSEYILLPLLQFIHQFVSNFGLVIIIFTIIIKFALHPLNKQSLRSMKKMQMLQPKITELKEKYKDDMQKQQQETMKLYSTYGINPMGGCLPMLLQMPILIALWSLLNVAIDIRQQPFIFWIDNLSAPDVLFRLPFKIPLFGIDVVSGLALMMGITMFIQQKMTIKDPSQKAMVYVMPVMFTLMFMALPSGLNLYYFMFNLFSITQQWYVNHRSNDIELVPVANPKKKQGFMARMMEAAEKQQQAQKKSSSKRK